MCVCVCVCVWPQNTKVSSADNRSYFLATMAPAIVHPFVATTKIRIKVRRTQSLESTQSYPHPNPDTLCIDCVLQQISFASAWPTLLFELEIKDQLTCSSWQLKFHSASIRLSKKNKKTNIKQTDSRRTGREKAQVLLQSSVQH